MSSGFQVLLDEFDKSKIFDYLIQLNSKLQNYIKEEELNYVESLDELTKIVSKFDITIPTVKQYKLKDSNEVKNYEFYQDEISLNIFKLISKNLVLIFHELSNKIFDFTNGLLNHLNLNDLGELSPIAKGSIVILIDLFETYPNSLNSLINFSITQIYKILKKNSNINDNLIALLHSITKNAVKSDIDDKFQAKLIKLINKNIINLNISYDLSTSELNDSMSTILLKRNYILCLKNLLILSCQTNYEALLELSTSSTSAGSKLKPDTIMLQQHQFQMNLLLSNEKLIHYGLSNYSKEIRVATVELYSYLLMNFISTGKFDPIDYLINQFNFPDLNNWDQSLSATIDPETEAVNIEIKKDKNLINSHDSESIIHQNTENLLFQTSIIKTLIIYIQLQQFQYSDFLSVNLINILDLILLKFSELNNLPNHFQNQYWNKVLRQWVLLVDYLIKECGSSCHETLSEYIYLKFSKNSSSLVQNDNEPSGKVTKDRKRDSSVFGLKTNKSSSKSSRNKNNNKSISSLFNPYQAALMLHIIELLLPFGTSFNHTSKNDDDELAIDEAESTMVDEEENQRREEKPFLSDLLLKLIINKSDYIRGYALNTLLKYALNNEVEINQIILKVYNIVNHEFASLGSDEVNSDDSTSSFASVKIMNNSLALSCLIKQTDSKLLQNSTIMKILSFCTQNLKHNNTNNQSNYLKNSACWIVLSSLVTFYNESEYIRLNSSQLLVFWKNLLTSQFISSSVESTTQEGQRKSIFENLKLRNSSLVCLFNYLNSIELSPESLKQVQFLLTKAYNYLTYLENNIEGVGSLTSFNDENFNKNDFNPNMTNNLIYTNYTGNKKLSFDRMITSLILYGKKIILQSFTKLSTLLKLDANSHMVIFLLKVFSESKIFSRIGDKPKDKSKNKALTTRVSDFDSTVPLLGEEYNYSFGVTSKFHVSTANIDELLIKLDIDRPIELGLYYKDSFMTDRINYPKSSIEKESEVNYNCWFDILESIVFESVDHNINYDLNVFLIKPYSLFYRESTNLLTSLVDLSIELFQLVFPQLSLKIQSSLLEQMRNSLTSKTIDPLRYKAISINISVALHGLLNNATRKRIQLDKDLVSTVLDIIDKIHGNHKQLVLINSDTIGMALSMISKASISDHISKHIKEIVNDIDPYKRGKSILILSKIYEHAHVGFSDIYNVISQLLNDPNPIVYHYSLNAASVLLENNLTNHQFIGDLIDTLHSNFLNDHFSYSIKNRILVNLNVKFGTIGLTTKLLKLSITALGPNLRDRSTSSRSKIKNLIIALSSGIGCLTVDDYLETFGQLLGLLQELVIFDPTLIEGEVEFFTDLLNLIITKNIKIGLVVTSPTSINKDAIFSFNSSFELYRSAYDCYTELIKVFGVQVLNKETVRLLWISMNLRPCDSLKKLIKLWLESSLDMNWFVQLNNLYKVSSKKLIGPFIENNYQQKLLPLQQRQKKKSRNQIDFKDEEVESIVAEDEDLSDKNEPITWEFKLFIYDLLNILLNAAHRNPKLLDQLKPKIQEIVKISFLGSTSSIPIIKLRGANLLDTALGLFGQLADPLYPGVSILEQQQAQIISALIPCFSPDSDAKVIVNAINVGSKFINLPRIKFYSKQRILKTLIYLLEEISSNKFLKFGFLEHMSEFSKKSIQLSILNCWALLKIDSEEDESTEPELKETLEKYSTLLTSLWILVLRELSSLKYNENSTRELELYDDYWINFVSVLSLQLEKDDEFIKTYLAEDESNFFFILFSQCVESLIKNKNVEEILISLNRLVQNSELVEILFHDEIFGEIIDLFDRLILIDENTEVKCNVLEIISTIFHTFLNNQNGEDLTKSFDKLFELIRVTMSPLFSILPFLRTDFDPTSETQQFSLKYCDSGPNLLILKKVFSKLVDMINKFPNVVKVDLYSCVLFIFAKFYEYNNELLNSILLPHLKQIILESKKFNLGLIDKFYNIIQKYYKISPANNFSVLTSLILITSGDIRLNEEDSEQLSCSLIEMLESPELAPRGIQCIKSLIQYSSLQSDDILVVKKLIKEIIKSLVANKNEHKIDIKVSFEILFMFSKLENHDESKSTLLFSILIPLLLSYNKAENGNDPALDKAYLNEKLLNLINQNPAAFKTVLNSALSDEQKQLTEQLVKFNPNTVETPDVVEGESEIQLKTFGV